jgi:plastocyanin
MTWRLHIYFSFSLAMFPLVAAPVTGRVELRDSKDPSVRKGLDYSGVVVWLEPVPPLSLPARKDLKARMEQRDKTFLPHVLAIEAGTRVDFPNFDPIFHSAFSNYEGRNFDVGLYAPGSSRTVFFGHRGIVRVFCNIHPTMSSVIVVVDTPYFSTTKKDGTFRIENVPAGEYRLRLFHERATEETLSALTRVIRVTDDPMVLSTTAISESGYLNVPHKNKYGRDYQTPPDQEGIYPAVRP